jgi:hypothetical protein
MLSHRLHPSMLEDRGVEAALRSHVKDFAQGHELAVRFHAEALSRPVPLQVATAQSRDGARKYAGAIAPRGWSVCPPISTRTREQDRRDRASEAGQTHERSPLLGC